MGHVFVAAERAATVRFRIDRGTCTMQAELLRCWADLLVDYCLELKPGESVLIAAETTAQALVEATAKAAVLRGAVPVIRLEIPGLTDFLIEHGSVDQLESVPVSAFADAGSVDARIRILADTDAARHVDPKKRAAFDKAREPLRRLASRKRWVLTQFPTETYAELAGMSLTEYEAFVASSMFLDREDPVAAWKSLGQRQSRVIDRMKSAAEVRLIAEGTDLTLNVAGRTWINSDGRRNMPSGEIFTGPHENSANGRLTCVRPVLRDGQKLEGISLVFEKGKVVEATANAGQDYLRAMIAMDDGASLVGELGIGLNEGIDRFSGSILYDEKIGGTAHVALGSSYPETGGTNRSALHWDFIVDLRAGGKIVADDQVVCENGQWQSG
jgi:aminopeptidase